MRAFIFVVCAFFGAQGVAATATDLGTKAGEAVNVATGAASWLEGEAREPLFNVGETPVSTRDLIWVLAILMSSALISKFIRVGLHGLAVKHENVSESAMFTIGRLLHYIIIVIAVFASFSFVGVDYTKLAIVAGALSVGIGFGLQSIFNNFISGLILLFERPIKVGDLIELDSGTRGRVKAINVRSTQVTTWDNIDVLVPNSEFVSGKVTNYTLGDDRRRLHVPFGVAYGSDKELVKKAVIEAALSVKNTLNSGHHKPDVWLLNFGDNSIDYELVVWVHGNKLPATKHPIGIYLWEIETKLSEYGIEIPFPQRDLHVRSVDPELIGAMRSSRQQT